MSRRLTRVAAIVAVALALPAATADAKLAFKKKDYPLAYAPGDVVIANFDGRRATTSRCPTRPARATCTCSGTGDGTFAKSSKPACAGAHEVAAGPIDGGKPDLLVLCTPVANPQAVSLLGNGSGGFGAPKPAGIGASPGDIELGEINGTDPPALDAAFEGYGNNLRKTGSSNGRAIYASNLDRDGDFDIVTGESSGKLGVFKWGKHGIPNGATAKLYSTVPLDDMALGDFNGDHKPDAAAVRNATGTESSSAVAISLGKGNTAFDAPKKFPAGVDLASHHIAVGDLNRDGRDDVAVTSYTGELTVLLSK